VIVCVCHAVPEKTLREAAARGLSAEEVVRATGAGTSCGCCAPAVEEILAEHGRCEHNEAPRCHGCPRAACLDVANDPARGEAA
jgi:bacterioferritin-associated ferredoxin